MKAWSRYIGSFVIFIVFAIINEILFSKSAFDLALREYINNSIGINVELKDYCVSVNLDKPEVLLDILRGKIFRAGPAAIKPSDFSLLIFPSTLPESLPSSRAIINKLISLRREGFELYGFGTVREASVCYFPKRLLPQTATTRAVLAVIPDPQSLPHKWFGLAYLLSVASFPGGETGLIKYTLFRILPLSFIEWLIIMSFIYLLIKRTGTADQKGGETPDYQKFASYALVRKIAEGGMAEVYLAYKIESGRVNKDRFYALKVMHSNLDEEGFSRFLREIEISNELNHPNIVKVYEGGIWNGKPYIVMEYIEGYVLEDLIKEDRLTLKDKLNIMKKICYGLSYAHQLGVIHRDIKPSNILISKDLKKVKITDFGLAKMLIKKTITVTGTTLGTPYYMAPEQLESKSVDHRADIYALGVTFYELLTGKLPFEGTPINIIYKHLNEEPRPMSEIRKGIPRKLEMIIMKMLRKRPEERYQTVDEIIRDLDIVISQLQDEVGRL